MLNKLAGIGLRGKRAAEHDEDDAKAKDDDEEAKAATSAEDHEDDEEEAKAQEEEDEKEAEEHEDDKEAKAAESAAKATRHKVRLNARAITDLCALAGKPEMAGEFIASGCSQAFVRRALLDGRADASGTGEIAGQTSPAGSPAAAAAMWDHATEKNNKAFGLGK